MKKLLVMILFVLLLTGCGIRTEYKKSDKESNMFVYIQKENAFQDRYYDVVYHKDTKVMYVISHGPYSYGNFTVLVNPDGTPMLYKGE